MVEISRGLILLCFYGCWNPFRILIVARSHGAVKNSWARMTIASLRSLRFESGDE